MRGRLAPLDLRVPSLKVSAVLVLLMLGFGVVVGEAAKTSVHDELLASARQHVELVLPHHAAAALAAPATTPPPAGEAMPTPPPEAASGRAPRVARRASSAPSPSAGTPSHGEGSKQPATRKPDRRLPAIRHVFVIMLSSEPYASVFGPASQAHYLTGRLEPRGALLPQYDAVAHEGLADDIALLSGQGPTAETAAGCPTYTAIAPTGSAPEQQVLGSGCVYPASTPTLPAELAAKHLSWRAYIGGIGETRGPAGACAHPPLGSADPSAAAGAEGPYATSINPIVYFASLSQGPACELDDVGLAGLAHDLASPARTPNLAYIAPSRCEDASPVPCTSGAPAGLAPADAFLKRVVPEILASKAYRKAGLLVITVDNAPASGEFADSSSCCGQPPYPNLPAALALSPSGRPRGGGTVGALLLSPFIKGPETSQEQYSHLSLLATIEELFGVRRLGYSALPQATPLEASLFSEP